MITSFDDYGVHQTSNPISQPAQSALNFYDRYWSCGYDVGGGFFFEAGLGVYPNRYVMDGHFTVVIDGVQHSFHGSCRCPDDRRKTRIGPLALIIEEPMRRMRVRLESNDTGISCDLLFVAASTPIEEVKNVMHEGDVRLTMMNSRFTQFGRWEGWLEADGKRVEVSGESTLGTRDKSWGVRPLGEPEGGAPDIAAATPCVYWAWLPLNFGDVCTQFGSFESPQGEPRQLGACLTPLYDKPEDIPEIEPAHVEMATARHAIEWRSGTRWPQRGHFELERADGKVHQIEIEASGCYCSVRGLGYHHPDWPHGAWQGELKTGSSVWDMNDVDFKDHTFVHVHTLVNATLDGKKGTGMLETLVFGPHARSGFKEFLDLAP